MRPIPIRRAVFHENPCGIPISHIVPILRKQILHTPGVFPRKIKFDQANAGFTALRNGRVPDLDVVGNEVCWKKDKHQPDNEEYFFPTADALGAKMSTSIYPFHDCHIHNGHIHDGQPPVGHIFFTLPTFDIARFVRPTDSLNLYLHCC